MKETDPIKLAFPLNPEGGWPPVSVENIWLDLMADDELYSVLSSPFFVKNMAYKDIIEIVVDQNLDVIETSLHTSSGYSTIWIMASNVSGYNAALTSLASKEWLSEGIEAFKLISVALPPTATLKDFDQWCGVLPRKTEFSFAYPCLRHS